MSTTTLALKQSFLVGKFSGFPYRRRLSPFPAVLRNFFLLIPTLFFFLLERCHIIICFMCMYILFRVLIIHYFWVIKGENSILITLFADTCVYLMKCLFSPSVWVFLFLFFLQITKIWEEVHVGTSKFLVLYVGSKLIFFFLLLFFVCYFKGFGQEDK